MEQDNIHVVTSIFDAFGRGDVPAILTFVDENVEWEIPGPESVSYYGPRRGHEGVGNFFAAIGSAVEFETLEPREFIARDDKVVVLGSERGRVRETGKSFEQEWAMVFSVHEGKVTRFFCYENTAAVVEAFRA